MFFKLVLRNSRRSGRENLLFMSSLIISVISFYVVLSLGDQDIVRYLKMTEQDAVEKLIAMIAALYTFTLAMLFFLIYYASKYQIDRRSHELGVYMMMGMRRRKLLSMLLAEDIASTAVSLVIGLPVALLLTELISLFTVKMIGIGFIGHQTTFSIRACAVTCLGFMLIKFMSFVIISFKFSRKDIGTLLADRPENTKRQKKPGVYLVTSIIGLLFLAAAYAIGITGVAYEGLIYMILTLVAGMSGTFMLFWGMRYFMDKIARKGGKTQLHVFNFRQVQDTVICRSGTMAICSLLILASVICMGAGAGTFSACDLYKFHYTDYTFSGATLEEVQSALEKAEVEDCFASLQEMRYGYARTSEDPDNIDVSEFLFLFDELDPEGRYHDDYTARYPSLLSLSDYNRLLESCGCPALDISSGQAGVYMDPDMISGRSREIIEEILTYEPSVYIDGGEYVLKGPAQGVPLVTDYMLSVSFALIIPDEDFEYYTCGNYSTYINGILKEDSFINGNYFETYISINDAIARKSGLNDYQVESYLINMGRQLFYLVAASYVTIYLAVIFFVIANTILGVQFLMGQRKSHYRYGTLIRLGAEYEVLCKSSSRQINWFFGIPVAIACMSSLFGIRAVFSGILSSRTSVNMNNMLLFSLVAIAAFCLVEFIYITIVKRSSFRYLDSLMAPEREE